MIPFVKAHACGNDFLIITDEAAADLDRAHLTRHLCARNTGVGADGIEFFSWTGPKSGRIRLHNADGSMAEISGNGTRCVAAWMSTLIDANTGDELRIETDAGLRVCRIDAVATEGSHAVEVTTGMGVPIAALKTVALANGITIQGAAVDTGNPHYVVLVENAEFAVAHQPWQVVGARLCTHIDFQNHTNVEFLRIVHDDEIEIRIFERGVGPTTSSGTGSSAAATAAIAFHHCISPLRVVAPGGAQIVTWSGTGTELELTGPAALIARGEAWYQ